MSVYQDRIQGMDRLLRIRRMKRVVYAILLSLTALLIYARLLSEGAEFKPLFLPLNGALEAGLLMGLVGTLLGFYFRRMEIQASGTDSQRYLMSKYSMGRAVTTAALCIVLAGLLLIPAVASGAASVFTDQPVPLEVTPTNTVRYNFTSPDPFGVSFVRHALITTTSGPVRVSLLRNNLSVGVWTVASGAPLPIPVEPSGWAGLATWSLLFRINTTGTTVSAIVDLTLEMGVMPTLFSTVPFLLILYAGASIAWWFYLRPIRGRSKTDALYAGGATTVDGGERAWAEYAANPVADVIPMTTMTVPPPPPPSAPPPPPGPTPSPTLRPAAAAPRPESRAAPSRAETPETLVSKGDALAMALQYAPALIAYDEALRLQSDYLPALVAKAGALAALGKGAEALVVYRKVLDKDPGHEPALRACVKILVKGTRWREAMEVVETFLRRRPSDIEMLEIKGDILSNLGRRPEALAAYEAATALDPSNANVKQKIEEVRVDVPGLLSRALIASAHGNYAQALNLFDDILEVEPSNVNALIGKAVAYRRSGKPQEALNCLDLVLNIQPNNAAAFLNRGNVLVERGDLEGALGTFDKLVAVAPDDGEAWAARGDVLVRLGHDDDAARSYGEALKRDPGDEEVQRKIQEIEESRNVQADVLQELYKVKGIGPARAKALVDAGFRTAEDFRKASVEQLLAVKGVTHRIAEDLVKHFHGVLVEAR